MKAKGQTPEERAKVSAPPGHSEHATGYAVDIQKTKTGHCLKMEILVKY